MEKGPLVEYKRQLTQLKRIKEQQQNKESQVQEEKQTGMVMRLGVHPLFKKNSNNLFKNDERGYLSAILLGALVFTFEIAFLAVNYLIFKN